MDSKRKLMVYISFLLHEDLHTRARKLLNIYYFTEGETAIQYSDAPQSLCLTFWSSGNSAGIEAMQQMGGRRWTRCQFWLRLKGKIIYWREAELYRKSHTAMDYLHTLNISPNDQTQQYTLLTELLYLTPASILASNDLLKSVFTNLRVQQTSMRLLIEYLNYFQENKGEKAPLLSRTNIYRVELSRAAGLPQDRVKHYLFQFFCKLFIWEITYPWDFHVDFCLGHKLWVNLRCIQSHASWRPFVRPEGNSVLFHCVLRRKHAVRNCKGFGERTGSFENSSCASNKKENPECHNNSQ